MYLLHLAHFMRELIANIARITDLLPIILFIILFLKRKENINKGLWVIFLYTVLVALNDIVLFNFIPDEHSNILFSTFTLVEYFSFSLFLGFHTENKRFKQMLTIVFVLFTIFICTYFLIVPFDFIDSIPIGVETILVIGFSVYFLYEMVNKSTILLYNTTEFWIITGFLIYLAGSFFIYLYANQVPENELYKFFFVTFIFNTIKNIFIAVGFWLAYKSPKAPSIHHPHEYQPFLN